MGSGPGACSRSVFVGPGVDICLGVYSGVFVKGSGSVRVCMTFGV